jgi:hypothetical protein
VRCAIIGAFTSAGFPVESAIKSASSINCGGSQVAGEHVAPGKEAERELQVHECAGVTGDLYLASREETHGLVVPHLERGSIWVRSKIICAT